MTISLTKVLEDISEFKPVIHSKHPAFVKCCHLFNKDLKKLIPESLYVGCASELPDLPTRQLKLNFILLIDAPVPSEYLKNDFINIIEIDAVNKLTEVFNRVQDCFNTQEFMSTANIELMNALCAGSSVQHILNIGYEYLENPIMVCDQSLSVIDIANGDTNPEDAMWVYGMKFGQMPDWYINEINNEPMQAKRLETNFTPLLWKRSGNKKRLMMLKITAQGKCIGYIKVLEQNRIFSQNDIELLPILSKAIGTRLQYEKYGVNMPESILESFIINLLIMDNMDPSIVHSRANNYNWYVSDDIYVICIQVADRNIPNDRYLYYKKRLSSYCPYSEAVIYKQTIILISDRNSGQELLNDSEMDKFRNFLIEENLIAGISRCYHDLADTPKYYRQAVNAVDVGCKSNCSGPIYPYGYQALRHMFEICAQSEDLLNFCNPIALQIEKYDRENCTNYLDTLANYIKHSQNMKKTSTEMFIHYNTMKYRVQKLQEFFNIDFDDGILMHQLWLSILLLRYDKVRKEISNSSKS